MYPKITISACLRVSHDCHKPPDFGVQVFDLLFVNL
jgi:hypothetical protein